MADGEGFLDSLPDLVAEAEERGQTIVYRPLGPPPEHTVRLMATLGVRIELPVSIQDLTETRICVAPMCTADAMKMSRFCRAHAPISELRPTNGHGVEDTTGKPSA